MKSDDFATFLDAIRRGDERAATELVQRFEPRLRRLIGFRLDQYRLRRILDSADICQSILARFFARAADGQFDLDDEEQLGKLLRTMAENKVRDNARRQRHCVGAIPEGLEPVALDPSPSEQLEEKEAQESVEEVRARLSERVRWLLDQRAEGRSWGELGLEVGSSPDALRMSVQRAVKCALKESRRSTTP
jgi:RNA polymerase sigma factor (sigma-70 family)